jgi:hypothetical protein
MRREVGEEGGEKVVYGEVRLAVGEKFMKCSNWRVGGLPWARNSSRSSTRNGGGCSHPAMAVANCHLHSEGTQGQKRRTREHTEGLERKRKRGRGERERAREREIESCRGTRVIPVVTLVGIH